MDGSTEAVKLVKALYVGRLNAAVYFRLKVIVLHEPLVGLCRDDKPVGNFQMNPVSDLPEICDFASDLVRQIFVHGFEGENQRSRFQQASMVNKRVDFFLNFFETLMEFLILFRGQFSQMFYNLPDIGGDTGAPGHNKGHAKRPGAPQGLLYFGHDLQCLVVGV